jgi:hypothetical protein
MVNWVQEKWRILLWLLVWWICCHMEGKGLRLWQEQTWLLLLLLWAWLQKV